VLHLGFELAGFLFGAFAIGNIGDGPDATGDATRGVALGGEVGQSPDGSTVAPDDAVFEGTGGAAGQDFAPFGGEADAILRIEDLVPPAEGGFLGVDSANFGGTFIEVEAAAGGVGAKDTDRREIGEDLIMLLGLPQVFVGLGEFGGALGHADGQFVARRTEGLARMAGVGDVEAGADITGEAPGGIETGLSGVDDPAVFAIGAAHAILRLEALAGGQGAHEIVHTVLAILGMKAIQPPLAELVFQGTAGEIQPGSIDEGTLAEGVGHPNESGDGVGHAAKAPFALLEGLFGADAMGDVLSVTEHALGRAGHFIKHIAVKPGALCSIARDQAHETRVDAIAADAIEVGIEQMLEGGGDKALHVDADTLFGAKAEGLGGGRIDDQQDAFEVMNAHEAQAVFEQFAVEALILAQLRDAEAGIGEFAGELRVLVAACFSQVCRRRAIRLPVKTIEICGLNRYDFSHVKADFIRVTQKPRTGKQYDFDATRRYAATLRVSMMRKKAYPEVRALLEANEAGGGPALETLSPAEARQAAIDGLRSTAGQAEEIGSVENLTIPYPGRPIPVRVYRPAEEGPWACLIYFHGGGWVVCDLDTHDAACRAIARRAGAVVVAVDYRRSPEYRFPAAVEDCYAATQWVAANAARLEVDARRIAVGGDSAGGNLAAVMCLKSRDEGGPAIALQALVYPVTNLSSFATASYEEFADGYYLTRAEMEWFRGNYLARAEDAESPYASPLLARDLGGLPPAVVITAECDPLRDEGEAYARRLAEAGVEVSCTRYGGMIHPFFSLGAVLSQGRRAIEQVAAAVRGLGL